MIYYGQYCFACIRNVLYPKVRFWIFLSALVFWWSHPTPQKLIVWFYSLTASPKTFQRIFHCMHDNSWYKLQTLLLIVQSLPSPTMSLIYFQSLLNVLRAHFCSDTPWLGQPKPARFQYLPKNCGTKPGWYYSSWLTKN